MCGGCRVTVGGQTKFTCVDGPEFDGHLVDFDNLMKRLGAYKKQEDMAPAIRQAEKWMAEFKVPVVIEVILERVTNIAMGTEIDNVTEFEELAGGKTDVPTAIAMLD